MNKFLNYRIAFITILFTAFGGVLSTMMNIESVGSWSYAAIACMIALITSLLISLLLKGEWDKQMQLRIRRIGIGLFIAFFVCCFFFIWLFRFQLTFEMKEFDYDNKSQSGIVTYNTVRYLKGVYYTTDALSYLKDNPGAENDHVSLVKAFGGSGEIESIWDNHSRNLAQFYLLLCYGVVVVLFVANVSLLCEVLVTKYALSTTSSTAN